MVLLSPLRYALNVVVFIVFNTARVPCSFLPLLFRGSSVDLLYLSCNFARPTVSEYGLQLVEPGPPAPLPRDLATALFLPKGLSSLGFPPTLLTSGFNVGPSGPHRPGSPVAFPLFFAGMSIISPFPQDIIALGLHLFRCPSTNSPPLPGRQLRATFNGRFFLPSESSGVNSRPASFPPTQPSGGFI